MYSIFSTKNKIHHYLEEGEPPPKKAVAEEDILIKRIAENQLKTNISLAEHLSKRKEFTSSESYLNVTSYVSGKTDLKDFQTRVCNVETLNILKSRGVSDKNIEIYTDYKNLGPEFWMKYKYVNRDTLSKLINDINTTIVATEGDGDYSDSVPATSNNQQEYLDSLKSSIPKTKLLKLVMQNEPKKVHLQGPMDILPSLEQQFMNNLDEYSNVDINKIRKKARSIANKIRDLETTENSVGTDYNKQSVRRNKSPQRRSLWDMKEKPTHLQKTIEIIDKNKVYDCKPQNWYTIKDGTIIKLDKNNALFPNKAEKSKLTLEEIKSIPKFTNYDSGIPSKVLFLKNLGKNVTEIHLRSLLKQFEGHCYCVKVMNGKMKGQAFMDFQDANQATEALKCLNGVLLNRKPIIVQYGKKEVDLK